jgi:hypothetical protein
MSESKRWIVTTSGVRPLSEVAKDLTDTGFAIEKVLDEIGCITGSASKDAVQRVRAIPGVTDVSPDEPIDIGPPGPPVTW